MQNDKNYIFEIPYGIFRIDSGKIFKKAVQVKRFECLEVSSGKMYLLIQMLRWNCC
jgi:hypothetical protein